MTDLKNLIEKRFKIFGLNKKAEIARLVYEIAKKDKRSYLKVISCIPVTFKNNYNKIKSCLLEARFPDLAAGGYPIKPHLPKLHIDPGNAVSIKNTPVSPENIFIENSVKNSYLVKNLKAAFPKAALGTIDLYKNFIKRRASGKTPVQEYNKRREVFFVVGQAHDFFKKCPCTKGALSCGYHVFNLGFGCIFECTYCYLQEYTNCPGIALPANLDAFFDSFRHYAKPGMRLGTGEFTDSLALDHITEYSPQLIDFFKKYPKVTFEFKTKSSNIGNLLRVSHKGNIVISWSLNPQNLIKENEFYTAPLEKRLKAALECTRAGYRVGFHFDPIIYHRGWEKGYSDLVQRLFDTVPQGAIAWISLGSLRFNPRLKSIIENRFPGNTILDGELVLGFDNKMRYGQNPRYYMYKNMLNGIRSRSKRVRVYLCMEEEDIMSIRS